jgi:histidinol-phosphate aminotransferase
MRRPREFMTRDAVRKLPAYHPPLAGRDGLRFDFNENTIGCSPRVLERLRQMTAEDLARYPEREPVERIVASFLEVAPSEILLANGVDEAIHLLCQAYLQSGDEALIVVPAYSMYRIYMMAAGAEMIAVPYKANFCFPMEDALNRITPRTRMIAIANPNNPTGTIVSQQDLFKIANAAPQAALLIDEAYFEFCGQTVLPRHREFPNLFIARTFSKVYGLAGLRIGALVGHEDQMCTLRRVASPYNVNAVALACLPEALADQKFIAAYVSDIRLQRARLERTLSANEIEFWPSHANFVLMRVGPSKADAAMFVEHMRQRGILVRDRSADYGCEGCVRITLGPREHTDRLLAVMEEVFHEMGCAQGAKAQRERQGASRS